MAIATDLATASTTASRRLPRAGFGPPVLLATVLVIAAYACSPNFVSFEAGPEASPYAGDFLQEWIGGWMVLSGERARFYEPAFAQALEHNEQLVPFTWDQQRYLPMVYPPFYYLLVSPLAWLPMKTAAWVWAGLLIAALAGTFRLLYSAALRGEGVFKIWRRRSGTRQSSEASSNDGSLGDFRYGSQWAAFAPWAVLAAVAFVPTIENFTSSQKGTVCLLIVTATFLLLNRGRPFSAGLVFGLLAFKPQLTLVIALAMLLKRQGRFVAGGALTGVTLVGLCFVLGGDVCRQYFEFAAAAADYAGNAGYDLQKSHCLYGFFALLSGGPGTSAKGMTALASGGVVGLLVLLMRGKLHPGTPRFAIQFSALVTATVLLSPHLFTYDLALLLLPAFLLFVLIGAGGVLRSSSLIAWLLLGIYAAAGFSVGFAEQTGVQLTVPLLVSLFVLLVWESGSRRYARDDGEKVFAAA